MKRSPKRNRKVLAFVLLTLVFSLGFSAEAQTKPATADRPKVGDQVKTLVDAADEYKSSSEKLMLLQQEQISKATENISQLRQLVADGLIARKELDDAERSLAALQAKLDATRQQIADSEHTIAQIMTSEETAKAARQAGTAPNLTRPTILRYNGATSWSLANLPGLNSFFISKFGHALPTSAIGQSSTHDRLGYDHRNAVDVALHPDSVEGRALIAYLQTIGVPYLAFRSAIPGVATGPHIHVGTPSHRI